jgi:serine/threonine-protein phosphatase 2A regulatory subunit A
VFSIREAASKNFKELIDVFGVGWAKSTIIPKVLEFCNHPNYHLRATTLLCVNSLSVAVGAEMTDSTLLPLALKMVTDNVPNIRFRLARTLAILAQNCETIVAQQRIRPALESLLSDTDKDVRYEAHKAMQVAGFA